MEKLSRKEVTLNKLTSYWKSGLGNIRWVDLSPSLQLRTKRHKLHHLAPDIRCHKTSLRIKGRKPMRTFLALDRLQRKGQSAGEA